MTAQAPERRFWVRHLFFLGARVDSACLRAPGRAAEVLDVSHGGIGLLLAEPLPRGAALRVEVVGWEGRVLLARVRHVQQRPGGWLHGCQLAEPLLTHELAGLLDLVSLQCEDTARPVG